MQGDDPKVSSPWRDFARIFTRVTAYAPLGSGVSGITTFGLWAACLLAGALGVTFILCGYPLYAIGETALCGAWYLVYQNRTWNGVSGNPDASVTGEQHYAHVIQIRHGAKNTAIIDGRATPVVGMTVADTASPAAKMDHDDA